MNTGTNVAAQNENAFLHTEGPVARTIEKQTARLPSDLFLWAASAAVIASLGFQIAGIARGDRKGVARAPLASFIGMWVPSLLMLGVYNKIVKVAGSDRIRG